jgi:hypothetical protein
MPPGARRQQPAAGRALDEALLQQEGLDHFLDGVPRLRQRRGDGLDARRAALVSLCDQTEIAAVGAVQPGLVDAEPGQRPVGQRALTARRPRPPRNPRPG